MVCDAPGLCSGARPAGSADIRLEAFRSNHVHASVGAPRKETDEHITLTGQATAAIAMALHLYYNGVHDEEPTHITIKKIERKYSPWNAKIMGMNNLHRN